MKQRAKDFVYNGNLVDYKKEGWKMEARVKVQTKKKIQILK